MDPHTHKQLITGGHNTSWGESSSFENMASMEDHSHSHVFFHDQQHHLPSLDHHSLWQSSSSHYNNNYIIPFSQSHHIISSPSLFFVGSSAANHHQPTLDHQYDHIPEKLEVGHGRDLAAGNEEEDDEGADEVDEELSAMKEMMYKIAAMQPVDIDPSTIRKPKRRNVRISDDPQSVAARHRRERISEKMRILQRLVPGGTKMDTASMLDEAIRYVKFLKRQIKHLQQENHPQLRLTSLKSCLNTCADDDHYQHHLTNKQQQQQCARNTLLLHHHDSQAEESLDLTSNKHDCMANNNSTVHTQEMDVFNQVIGGFTNIDHQR